MALLVQNDAGTVDGANSYVTLAEFKTYHTDRDNDYSAYSDGKLNAALIRATDYIDTRFAFRGVTLTTTQSTQWPRRAGSEVVLPFMDINFLDPFTDSNLDGNGVIALVGPDGQDILGIPTAIKRADMEYAFRALSQLLFQDAPAPEGGRLIDEHTVKVDVIEETIKYTAPQSGAFAMPAFPQADMWLTRAGLIQAGRTLYR